MNQWHPHAAISLPASSASKPAAADPKSSREFTGTHRPPPGVGSGFPVGFLLAPYRSSETEHLKKCNFGVCRSISFSPFLARLSDKLSRKKPQHQQIIFVTNTNMADIRTLDPRLLLTFVTVFDERNISRASAKLGRTQQGTSSSIARLRDVFEDQLFVRHGHGVEPTPKAEQIYSTVVKVLKSLEELVDAGEFTPMTVKRSLRIAAADYALSTTIRPIIRELPALAPHLDIQVEAFRGQADPSDFGYQGVDLLITVPDFLPPNLHFTTLFTDNYVVAARRDHPIARAPISLGAFCAASHLLVSPNRGDRAGVTDTALHGVGRSRRVSVIVPVFSVAPRILAETDLVAVLPERLVREHEDLITGLPLPIEIPPFDIVAAWPERVHEDPLSVWFRELVRIYLGDR